MPRGGRAATWGGCSLGGRCCRAGADGSVSEPRGQLVTETGPCGRRMAPVSTETRQPPAGCRSTPPRGGVSQPPRAGPASGHRAGPASEAAGPRFRRSDERAFPVRRCARLRGGPAVRLGTGAHFHHSRHRDDGTGRDSRGRGRCVPGPAPGGGWASGGLQDTSWDKQALTATPAGGRGPGTEEGSSSLCQLRGASQSREEGAARGARAGSGRCSGSVCGHSPSRTRPCPGRRGQATRAAGTDL